ncbi:unnamed protein product [Pedinophyceae sp. YPF-701]|nr:unnamed protein product [Pedinophyceae sp. YPF-701]
MSEAGGPASWADTLNSYRATWGSQSLSTVREQPGPQRYPRTNLTPFGRGPFHKDSHSIGADYNRDRPETEADRHGRHGRGYAEPWNKGKDYDRKLGERAAAALDSTRMAGTLRHSHDMRGLPCSANPDSWIGHPLVQPAQGKLAARPPEDPKGRRDLFDVVNQRAPGKPADDSWLGHMLTDPAKGRRNCPGPEKRSGREDLFPVMRFSALHEPRLGGPAPKERDPLADMWIGHRKIAPADGKRRVTSDLARESKALLEASLRWDGRPNNALAVEEMGGTSRRPGNYVPPGLKPSDAIGETVPRLINQDPSLQDEPNIRIRRYIPAPRRENPVRGMPGYREGRKMVQPSPFQREQIADNWAADEPLSIRWEVRERTLPRWTGTRPLNGSNLPWK